MNKEAEKNVFIAKRVIDAIDNFDELKIAYDEEKRVIREALVRFVQRVCAIADINSINETVTARAPLPALPESHIELVIKIPEEDFERCKKRFQMRIDIMSDAIANGTPLPKGHGRLIDADSFVQKHPLAFVRDVINDTPTIIDADKAESEEENADID